MASKLAHLLRRYPAALFLLLTLLALFGARFGHHGPPMPGLWDGPI